MKPGTIFSDQGCSTLLCLIDICSPCANNSVGRLWEKEFVDTGEHLCRLMLWPGEALLIHAEIQNFQFKFEENQKDALVQQTLLSNSSVCRCSLRKRSSLKTAKMASAELHCFKLRHVFDVGHDKRDKYSQPVEIQKNTDHNQSKITLKCSNDQ